MRGMERKAIQSKYKILVQDVRAQDIVDDLFADEVISFNTKERICAGETSRDKATRLVDGVLQSPLYEAYDRFLEALYNNSHEFLGTELENELKRQKRQNFKNHPNRCVTDECETFPSDISFEAVQRNGGKSERGENLSQGYDEVDFGSPSETTNSQTARTPNRQRNTPVHKHLKAISLSETSKVILFFTVSRKDSESYGFKIISGVGRPRTPGDLDYYITEVTPGSVAERCGLRRNDTLLEANNCILRHISYDDVIHMLKTVTCIRFKIVRIVKYLNKNRESVYV